MPKTNLASNIKFAQLLNLSADAAGRASRRVSLKYHTQATLIALVSQGSATPVNLTLFQSRDAAGLGIKPLTEPVPIWVNQDMATLDTLIRAQDGVSFTTSAALGDKVVMFHIDPAYLDVNNGYSYVSLSTGASAAANITAAHAQLSGQRYMGGNAPSVLL